MGEITGVGPQDVSMNMPPDPPTADAKIEGEKTIRLRKQEESLLRLKSLLAENNEGRKARYETDPEKGAIKNPERMREIVILALEQLDTLENDIYGLRNKQLISGGEKMDVLDHRQKQLEAIIDQALIPWAKKTEDIFANPDDLPEWLGNVGISKSENWMEIKTYGQIMEDQKDPYSSKDWKEKRKAQGEAMAKLASVTTPDSSVYLYDQTRHSGYYGIKKDRLVGKDWVFLKTGNAMFMRAIDYENLHFGYDELGTPAEQE